MSGKKIVIVTDSSAYIPPEAQEGLDISVIPLWLLWDGKSYQDGLDIFPAEFYSRLKYAKLCRHHRSPRRKNLLPSIEKS